MTVHSTSVRDAIVGRSPLPGDAAPHLVAPDQVENDTGVEHDEPLCPASRQLSQRRFDFLLALLARPLPEDSGDKERLRRCGPEGGVPGLLHLLIDRIVVDLDAGGFRIAFQ